MATIISTIQKTEPFPDQFTHVYHAADYAYRAIAAGCATPDEVSRWQVCHRVSELMVEALKDTEPHATIVTTYWGRTVRVHSYVLVRPYDISGIADSEDLIADGTWKQFVDRNKVPEDAPHVVVGRRLEVIETLGQYGVDAMTLELWDQK